MMPRLDGYQTCQIIKNNKRFKHTPVIMLSSKDGLFDRARGRIAGSQEHVNKPFTQEELIDVINISTSTESTGGPVTTATNRLEQHDGYQERPDRR